MPHNLLALEASTQTGSIALFADGNLLIEFLVNPYTANHSESLMPAVDRVLTEGNIPLKEIDFYAVSIGPGSFTGLRVGISIMKGLALATGKPLVGISTLDVLAYNIPFSPYLICPIIDARKKQVYTALYMADNKGTLKKVREEYAVYPDELALNIYEKAIFLGSGVKTYKDVIKSTARYPVIFAPENLNYPRASILGILGMEKVHANEFLDPDHFIPNYIRPSEAELNLYAPPNFTT
ncbi:MAG: tRNA (adenosine(37)-N6)-threonylcarbamoyltransferase complex dimerization subunit type 1 TsaB [Thermodesulfobacteriota bacterium]|nr:tRNA (adenosine(37)-N6)-threonylcarbamoyltransferase complex dimerization subunit type 1 TsaB [Thermodesulfobacteriota bacterium]